MKDLLNTVQKIKTEKGEYSYFSIAELAAKKNKDLSKIPFSIKILLETLLRNYDNEIITEKEIDMLLNWDGQKMKDSEIAFMPARVLLQDFTGVPAVVDLAALRSAIDRLGGDPEKINPVLPVDLVIDHSIQVDSYGSKDSLQINMDKEFERNAERYKFLRWGQKAFNNFNVIPPGTGIIHQVNLEYLAKVVQTKKVGDETFAYPDTVVGTDSHTTMINGLGVLGWGVGGIEAEAAMLEQPVYMLTPEVVGFKLTGEMAAGITATDLVLTITQKLREHSVVGKFVEFYGPGLKTLSLENKATIANMAPEYGATMGFFPVDKRTISFLKESGRDNEQIELIEKYLKAQRLFMDNDTPEPIFSSSLELDINTVQASLAGPKRPQDRINLGDMKSNFSNLLGAKEGFSVDNSELNKEAKIDNGETLKHGSLVIASITSCTNTSNPSVMIAAGLVAQKASELGLKVPKYVKTSLAPGSKIVTDYLKKSNLLVPLENLGFNVVGYGCATCIGNSGPLSKIVSKTISQENLIASAVVSGNRNFEGRISPLVKANYLASPPIVVAFALAGKIDIDLTNEPIGNDANNNPVFLKEIWPSNDEINEAIKSSLDNEMFKKNYTNVGESNEEWNNISVETGKIYNWENDSTYVREPSFFDGLTKELPPREEIKDARVLVKVGDSVTTDHISPAGTIASDGPAAKYLQENGISPENFNSFGSRRGNHEVMMRGTFANIRLKNLLAPGTEGGYTTHFPSNEVASIFEASKKYKEENTNLILFAGKDYGMGSSRDWAAKGVYLLGVKAVIAESYERIHRSNLIGMGILPFEFVAGENSEKYALTGKEKYSIMDIDKDLKLGQLVKIIAESDAGKITEFSVILRIDTPVELSYYRNGGILQTVLRNLI